MRFIKLTTIEEQTLKEGYKNHPKFHVRQRFHALLLSHEGMPIPQIKQIIKTRSRTIYTWMDKWENKGLVGLMIVPGRGVKSKLSVQNIALVELIKKSKKIRT
jgi:transposase